ncbi:unnamed protein product [Protopolystoma xenopodis]|uniref:Uncharacterized protein n=1 Tax=Protopolystoma xenopodis TaxID=117903 RepID=A0A3S5CKI9_9PLAT|nr:unnamed protein product [Protopolystoma xenopodis]
MRRLESHACRVIEKFRGHPCSISRKFLKLFFFSIITSSLGLRKPNDMKAAQNHELLTSLLTSDGHHLISVFKTGLKVDLLPFDLCRPVVRSRRESRGPESRPPGGLSPHRITGIPLRSSESRSVLKAVVLAVSISQDGNLAVTGKQNAGLTKLVLLLGFQNTF